MTAAAQDFEGINWFRFLIDVFETLTRLASRLYDFLHYEIPLRLTIDIGFVEINIPPSWFPLAEDIPASITMWEFVGGTALIAILVLVLLKYIIPLL